MKTTKPALSSRSLLASIVVLVAVAVAWALFSPPRRSATTPGASSPSTTGSASAAASASPATSASETNSDRPAPPVSQGESPILRRTTIAEAAGIAKPRPRSPLERSPGYFPPDDPESMSVVTGRRDAPAVDLELTGGATSIDQLGRRLLAGINARDEGAIHALGVTRREFEVILWREFPESRPVTHITADDAWEMSSIQSNAGVGRTLGALGYRRLEFIRVDTGPPVPYRNFTLYRKVEIVTRDPATSQEVRVGFAPSFVERHGRFKVLTFKD